MVELPGKDLEVRLVSLEGDSVPDFATEHELGRIHEVIHHILEIWLESLLVDDVEVDFLIGSDLNSNIALDEVDLASHVVESFVLFPETCLLVDLEEQD